MKDSLLITGFPCGEKPWRNILKNGNHTHLTLSKILSACNSHDLRDMAKVVADQISAVDCKHIIAHDIGVTISIMALLKRASQGHDLPLSLVLFNGAFYGFDVLKARHSFLIQIKSDLQIKIELEKFGVELDPSLLTKMTLIKKTYRQIIAISLLQKLKNIFKRKLIKHQLLIPTMILEGTNDPFIPRSSIDELENLFKDVRRSQSHEGHFPYLAPTDPIYESIRRFQAERSAL